MLDASGGMRWSDCGARFDGTNDEFHLDSRLMIIRCGLHWSERLDKNIPDVYYFVWDDGRFKRLLFIPGAQPSSKAH